MALDGDSCYAAIAARDARFDGLFYVGVRTTGIYCRPVCPARTPRRDRCRFFRTAAEAEKAGFRACFRCRPEVAPGRSRSPADAMPWLVENAVDLIDEGYLNERSVDELGRELGVSARHVRRAMESAIGVSPVELAQTRRLALAKQLVQDTGLGLAEVAFASGFQSVRRFNASFVARFGRAPSEVRRAHADGERRGALSLRLDYRAPHDWARLLGFLGERAIPGVERVSRGEYRRVARLDGKTGLVGVRRDAGRPALRADVSLALSGALMRLVSRLRALFDLDARPDAIRAGLGSDPELARKVRRRPGLRLPGCIDPFETAVRAILGQQISVRAATTLAGRLVERFGERLDEGVAEPGLTHRFPEAAELAGASSRELASIGLPAKRAESLSEIARAFASGALAVPGRDSSASEFRRRLVSLPGVGEWTAEYLAMRALHDPDAFPANDLGVRMALGGANARRARERAEAWRPWRSYAVMHLWTSISEGDSP